MFSFQGNNFLIFPSNHKTINYFYIEQIKVARMSNLLLNILSLGTKPLYEKQMKFHNTIIAFRNRLDRLKEVPLTEEEIAAFYDAINNFDFSLVLFSGHYKKYIDNLNRFKPQSINGNMDLTFLMIAIAEDVWRPTKPYDIFVYNIKYKNKLTSKFFIGRQKKQNLKKLNSPEAKSKLNAKPKSTKEWTRVPLPRDRNK